MASGKGHLRWRNYPLLKAERFLSNYKTSLVGDTSLDQLLEQYLLVDQECFINDCRLAP